MIHEKPAGSHPSLAAPGLALAYATAVVVATEFIVVGLLPRMANDLRISLAWAGGFVSWFALASAIAGPVLTLAAARFPPRWAIVLALLPFVLGNAAAAWASSYEAIAAARIMQGAALPVLVSIGGAALSRTAGPGREGRAVSMVYYGVIAGTVVAMPAGIVLAAAASWQATFVTLGALSLIAAAPFAFADLLPADGQPAARGQLRVLRRPALLAHLGLSIVMFAAMFAPYTYLAAMLEENAGLTQNAVAAVMMGFGAAGIAGNWAAGWWSANATQATLAATLVMAACMAMVPLLGGRLGGLLPLLAVWGAAHAAGFLLCQLRAMQAAPEAPALAAALNISAANIGITLGAGVGGLAAGRFGVSATGLAGAALAVLAAAGTMVLLRAPTRWRLGVRPA